MAAPILGFNRVRPDLVDETVRRVVRDTKDPLFALNDAAFCEVRRLQLSGAHGDPELAAWRDLARKVGRLGADEMKRSLESVARMHAEDVAGNFDERVYRVASKAAGPLINALLSPRMLLEDFKGAFDLRALDGRVVVEGPIDHIRRLAEIGTLVFVPTHLSNFDSVVFGYALERAGLPPATYGAGKNLFTNPALSFFMHNLGAYKVDRRLKHQLYKDVLKTYSCVLLERGFHSLFFPGGTRSRSGGVERRLKLGLAGTGVEAFQNTALAGSPRRVFFVPATINYMLTLEAESLIDEFLQESGKARYVLQDDDESTRVSRIASFLRKLAMHDAGVVIRFSKPIDIVGNLVNEDGDSLDPGGRAFDPIGYLRSARTGEVVADDVRNAEYTRQLGVAIAEGYKRDTVLLPTHLVAAAAFAYLREVLGGGDLFALLRHEDDVSVPRAELARRVEALRDKARALADQGKIRLAPSLLLDDGAGILAAGLKGFGGYHEHPVIESRGQDLLLEDTRLLFYYQNRLVAHGLAYDASSGALRV
jgi:glycerol-3-phosphate O-acyltransferase